MPNTLDLTIETDNQGRHFVVFPGHREELMPPRRYDDRLDWIRVSFDRFLVTVRELDEIRNSASIN